MFIHGSATGNLIAGNYIGTDATGTMALGNALVGVQITEMHRQHDRRHGGRGPQRHLRSARRRRVHPRQRAGNLVAGNYIGTDVTGTWPWATRSGVEITESAPTTRSAGPRPRTATSSPATRRGVFIHGSATGNLVEGNYIGTDVTGTQALGNAYAGAEINDSR